ncbi:MAG: hypothetical protein AAF702_28455 [Chloroflexota bacterium]
MKLSQAATFSGGAVLVATLFSTFVARPGLRMNSVFLPRKVWLLEQPELWQIHWWLWLVAIFSWMCLLVTFVWRYTPAHRVATMLQNGLMVISAVLAILGALVWMGTLPRIVMVDDPTIWVQLIDNLALTLLGGGAFMGGVVTLWITVDLLNLRKLTLSWLAPGILAGLALIPSPFLLPSFYHLILAAIFWVIWCIVLIIRRPEPKPFPELL